MSVLSLQLFVKNLRVIKKAMVNKGFRGARRNSGADMMVLWLAM